MLNLIQSLQTRDLGHVRIIAGLWGLELTCTENEAALKELTAALLNPELVQEILASLSLEARSALDQAGGSGR